MTRQTSIETYRAIESEGLLSQRRFEVYRVLFHHGPLTQGEAWNEFLNTNQRHSVAPRFAELEKMGVIQSVGERQCRLTGRNCMVWDVTRELPVKLEKQARMTRKELEARLEEALAELARLKEKPQLEMFR